MKSIKIFVAVVLVIIAVVLWQFGKKEVEPSPVQNEMIRVSTPTEGQVITSPLVITGEARGNWFFEASFPVVLVDWDGLILAQGIATAQGDWMTTEFVPFSASLTFPWPTSSDMKNSRGTLILKKDNPSGLPENDASVEVPIRFW